MQQLPAGCDAHNARYRRTHVAKCKQNTGKLGCNVVLSVETSGKTLGNNTANLQHGMPDGRAAGQSQCKRHCDHALCGTLHAIGSPKKSRCRAKHANTLFNNQAK